MSLTCQTVGERLDGTVQWQDELVKNGWTDALQTGDFLAEQDRNVQAVLRTLGVV